MATPIIMPRQGNTVETCIISKWHKQKGDKIKPGDILFTYETDKASFEEESSAEGILLDIFFGEDDEVPVLTNVCVIGNEGEDTSQFLPSGGKEIKEEAAKETIDTPKAALVTEPKAQKAHDEILRISPRARNLAEKELVDPKMAQGSGPLGRIIEKDIIELAAKGPKATRAAYEGFTVSDDKPQGTGIGKRVTASDINAALAVPVSEVIDDGYEDRKLPNIRKVIAKAMHHSLSTTAQLTLNSSFDASAILDLRAKLKTAAQTQSMPNITINDIILFAVSRTLKRHKDLNAHFLDDRIRYFDHANLGIAVDTDRGLLVPTLMTADTKSLSEIAVASKDLITKAQTGKITPDELTGGTFTITNLGTLGVESFTPVINPPQTAILGVNNIVYRQKKTDKGFETYPAMGLSLTFDHRALDGAPAARFLKDICETLENIFILLI